ncbi:tail sheath stabilizer and completion protein [uncultured Arcobacter sp.]|uniref:tail sheath stabilizer and completion protein n=1 Tax=uncultured Arcobacter sp. TaxID=165434 RepID=UPI002617DAE5|nr:tail sheath stabilizer and completion protein [uncultured Arcobacter sp.]
MLGSTFYFNTSKKYIVAFANLFKGIQVQRFDNAGNVVKTIDVPISYVGKSKLFYQLGRDSNKVSTVLPRIGFILRPVSRDVTRQISKYNTIDLTSSVTGEDIQITYNPVPYNFTFEVAILAKNYDDMLQITEQICPFFTPDYGISVNEIPEFGITRDLNVTLGDISIGVENEFGQEEDRIVTTDMTFTMKGWLYHPIRDSKVIETINTHLINKETLTEYETIQTEYNAITDSIDTTIIEGGA